MSRAVNDVIFQIEFRSQFESHQINTIMLDTLHSFPRCALYGQGESVTVSFYAFDCANTAFCIQQVIRSRAKLAPTRLFGIDCDVDSKE
jgi:hypothetical protein